MTQPATNPGQELIVRANTELAEFKKSGAHVLAPITLQTIPPLHRPVVSAVYINPDPNQKEVYPQRGGGLSISGIGWKKIADGMGFQIDDARSGRVDDGKDPNRCHYRVVGYIKSQDGTWRKLIGDKEIRMENVIEELRDNYKEKAQKYLDDPKDRDGFLKAWGNADNYVNEKVRQDALQIKKHILARAQSGAFARMVKSIGIRETYTAAELAKPFVFPKLVFELDPNHPEDRAFLRMQAAGAIDALYPHPQKALAAPPIEPSVRPVEFLEVPINLDVIEHQPSTAAPSPTSSAPQPSGPSSAQPEPAATPPDPDEVLKGEFPDAPAAEQAKILGDLVKRKAYRGKITGDMKEWKPSQRQGFFDKLMSLPDPVQTTAKTGTDNLPFE